MGLLISLLVASLSSAAFSIPGFELVVTKPIEASLSDQGIRAPLEVWREMIGGAKKTIDFGEMYASGGAPLDQILDSMEAAGKRGVKMRFILEEKMKHASDEPTLKRLREIPNLEMRMISFAKLSSGGIQHSKFFVVDKTSAFLGSQNFDFRSLLHIHETGLRITDKKVVKQMQAIFDLDWKSWALVEKGKRATKPWLPEEVKTGEAYLVASPPNFLPVGVGASEEELPKLLGQAKEEIRVQLLDYAPLSHDGTFYAPIDNALRAAYARGVKVKLMVSHWNLDAPAVNYLKSLAVLPGFEVRVVKIPPASAGPIPFARVNHSKFLEIDGKISWIGTSNWEGGYLDKSRNLEVVLKNPAFAAKLREVHEELWAQEYTKPIELDREYATPKKDGT
jgi:phosphatidylserine/phosphatidylglycerophosphate/cardiolipin synthase-like enzyme